MLGKKPAVLLERAIRDKGLQKFIFQKLLLIERFDILRRIVALAAESVNTEWIILMK